MKKILAFSALLLLAFTGNATSVGTGGLKYGTTLVLDGQCGFFGVEWGTGVAIINQSGSGCSSAQYGVGVSGGALTGHFGRAWVFSVHDTANPGTIYLYEFSYPPNLDGTWQAYATTDGKTFVNAGSGTYHTTK
jgi:hypothetical protein